MITEQLTQSDPFIQEQVVSTAADLLVVGLRGAAEEDFEQSLERTNATLQEQGIPAVLVSVSELPPTSYPLPKEQGQAIVIERLLKNPNIMPAIKSNRGRIHVLNRVFDLDEHMSVARGDIREPEDKDDLYYRDLLHKMSLTKFIRKSSGR